MKLPIRLGGLRVLLTGAVVGMAGQIARAAPIPLIPNGTVAPTQAAALADGTLVVTTTQTFASNDLPLHPNGTKFTGSLTTNVYSGLLNDPAGYTGLTFVYQLSNNGPSTLERLSTTDFTGAATAVEYDAATGTPPTTVDRDSTGGIIGWNFESSGFGRLPAPGNSATLIVYTNATSYQLALDSVIDSSSAGVLSYGPLVPEPASAAMVTLIGGLLATRRRRSI